MQMDVGLDTGDMLHKVYCDMMHKKLLLRFTINWLKLPSA